METEQSSTHEWLRLCGACHKLVVHEPDESEKSACSDPWDLMFAARSWWRCAACEQSDEPIREFQEPGRVIEEGHQKWMRFRSKRFPHNALDIWAWDA